MKTVNTLIEELQALVKQDENLGEVPVYVIADHGQMLIEANCVSIEYVEGDLEYSMDFTTDLEEAENLDDVKTFVCVGD